MKRNFGITVDEKGAEWESEEIKDETGKVVCSDKTGRREFTVKDGPEELIGKKVRISEEKVKMSFTDKVIGYNPRLEYKDANGEWQQ